MEKFDHQTIESKWQKVWEEKDLYSPNLKEATKPFYNLMMFPYPSAEGLHVGNMYAFTGVDVYGRYKRMQGYQVFEPIGLDGFGIHSENYALKINKHPKEQAKISQANFYRQLRATGNAYDWKRTVETYDPDYYKWTQWLFIQMFKAGLAYKAEAPVNWCPSCKTVLADEQVVKKGELDVCERCSTEVATKKLSQWFFRIASGKRPDGTPYPDSLLYNLDTIDWVEKVKVGQRNWIGRSEGVRLKFKVQSSKFKVKAEDCIEVFTTAIDTVYGVTFMVLSPEHPLAEQLSVGSKEAVNYIKDAKQKSQEERMGESREKTGVKTETFAVNPFNGEEIPIWIADYVLMGYGTGAVMGVPAHDARDREFALKYSLPVKPVIRPLPQYKDEISLEEDGFWDYPEIKSRFSSRSQLFDSEKFNGLTSTQAKEKLIQEIEQRALGKKEVNYHIRDWLISRQRYWGAPIPMVYCKRCAEKGNGWFPVPDQDLPVLLPDVKNWKPTGTGKAPLASVPEFVKTTCPNCGGEAERETDVCDTFLDSSWYFLRYPSVGVDPRVDPSRGKGGHMGPPLPWDPEITKKWLPVTSYIGGAEHTVLHLLYARFVTMALYDMGYIHFEEPFSRFYAHGLIIKEGAKMSKSRGNVVVPDEYIAAYGADALRTYLMFLGPFDQGGDFRDSGIAGMHRFMGRVWRLVNDWMENGNNAVGVGRGRPEERASHASPLQSLDRIMHRTIKEVSEDMENLRFNTAIAHIMEYVNAIQNQESRIKNQEGNDVIKTLILLLAPFMPHMTEELWQRLEARNWKLEARKETGSSKLDSSSIQHQASSFNPQASIHFHPWPTYDPAMIVEDTVEIVVQVNGKLRDRILMQNAECRMQNRVEQGAKASIKLQQYLEGKTIRKVIFVPGKLINFVI